MTDQQLQSSWPDLGALVIELRRLQQGALADRLVECVQYSSTSGEIYAGVGHALHENRALAKRLSGPGADAWQRVVADIKRKI
jgi:hypothetical protein